MENDSTATFKQNVSTLKKDHKLDALRELLESCIESGQLKFSGIILWDNNIFNSLFSLYGVSIRGITKGDKFDEMNETFQKYVVLLMDEQRNDQLMNLSKECSKIIIRFKDDPRLIIVRTFVGTISKDPLLLNQCFTEIFTSYNSEIIRIFLEFGADPNKVEKSSIIQPNVPLNMDFIHLLLQYNLHMDQHLALILFGEIKKSYHPIKESTIIVIRKIIMSFPKSEYSSQIYDFIMDRKLYELYIDYINKMKKEGVEFDKEHAMLLGIEYGFPDLVETMMEYYPEFTMERFIDAAKKYQDEYRQVSEQIYNLFVIYYPKLSKESYQFLFDISRKYGYTNLMNFLVSSDVQTIDENKNKILLGPEDFFDEEIEIRSNSEENEIQSDSEE